MIFVDVLFQCENKNSKKCALNYKTIAEEMISKIWINIRPAIWAVDMYRQTSGKPPMFLQILSSELSVLKINYCHLEQFYKSRNNCLQFVTETLNLKQNDYKSFQRQEDVSTITPSTSVLEQQVLNTTQGGHSIM